MNSTATLTVPAPYPETKVIESNHHLITVTGGDRVGKNTQAKLLAEALDAYFISFPDYESISGQLIRAALTRSKITLSRELQDDDGIVQEETEYSEVWDKRDNPYHFQCLQMLCRLEAQPAIHEALKTNHVVADRYDVDALVYGRLDGCDISWIEEFLKCIRGSDLVIILDGPTFTRNEIADINERDLSFSESIKLEYRKMAYPMINGCHLVRTVEMPDKVNSIWATHVVIMSVVNRFLQSRSASIVDPVRPLTVEEVKQCLALS